MHFISYIAVLVLFGMSSGIYANHQNVTTIRELLPIAKSHFPKVSPSEILIVWDIDMTLIQVDHPCDYYPVMKKYHSTYKSSYEGLSKMGRDMMGTKIGLSHKQRLVDPEAKLWINRLKKLGIKHVALTGMLSNDPCEHAGPVPERRYKQLQQFGITFDDSYPWAPKSHVFDSLPKWVNGKPTLYKGILQSNGTYKTKKGETLLAYFELLKKEAPSSLRFRLPKVVIFIDDSKRHVDEVGETLNKKLPGITYVGVVFAGAYKYAPTVPSKKEFTKFWMKFRRATDHCLHEKKCCD